MRLIADIARRYPWQTALMLLALVCAGFAEGLSLSSLLPMLSAAVVKDGAAGVGAHQQFKFLAAVLAGVFVDWHG